MFKILKIHERLLERYEPVLMGEIYNIYLYIDYWITKEKISVLDICLEDSQGGLLNKIYLIFEVESLLLFCGKFSIFKYPSF